MLPTINTTPLSNPTLRLSSKPLFFSGSDLSSEISPVYIPAISFVNGAIIKNSILPLFCMVSVELNALFSIALVLI